MRWEAYQLEEADCHEEPELVLHPLTFRGSFRLS